MNGPPFRPDHRPRHNRFRRRSNWNRGAGRLSPRYYEDGEILSQSPLPPPSPPWRRNYRFPRPVKRFRRNDFCARSVSPSPPRSQPPFLGPVPMLEIPIKRKSRFDITPDDARNGWPALQSNVNAPPRSFPYGDPPRNNSFRGSRADFGYNPEPRAEHKFSGDVSSFSSSNLHNISTLPNDYGLKSQFGSRADSALGSNLSPKHGAPNSETMTNSSFVPNNSQSQPFTGVSYWGPAPMDPGPRDPFQDSTQISTNTPDCMIVKTDEQNVIRSKDSNVFNNLTSSEVDIVGHDVPMPLKPTLDLHLVATESSSDILISTPPNSEAAPMTTDGVLPNQSELLLQIQKLDDEIAEIELKVAHQRNLIEEKTSAVNETEEPKPEEIVMVIAESEGSHEILTENRRLAALSSQAFSKLYPSWMTDRVGDGVFYEPLYREPGQFISYEQTEKKLAQDRPKLFRALRSRKLSQLNDECRLALQWWEQYRSWRQAMTKVELKCLPPLRHALTPDQRAFYLTRLAIIPPMLSQRDQQRASWRSKNALVEDPRAQDQFRKLINPWSEQEKAVFRKKFSKFPKNFVKLASFLPNKSVGDCVAYYYSSKNVVNYKGLVKKYRQSLLSRRGIDISSQNQLGEIRSSRIDTPALPTDQDDFKQATIPRELLKLAEDLSRNNLEVQSGRGRGGKKRRTDSDVSNVSMDAAV